MSPLRRSYFWLKKIVIGVVGIAVLLFGMALIFLPGPAFVFIPLGLVILGAEFAWARMWLKKLRAQISERGAINRAARSEQFRERSSRQ